MNEGGYGGRAPFRGLEKLIVDEVHRQVPDAFNAPAGWCGTGSASGGVDRRTSSNTGRASATPSAPILAWINLEQDPRWRPGLHSGLQQSLLDPFRNDRGH